MNELSASELAGVTKAEVERLVDLGSTSGTSGMLPARHGPTGR